MIRIGRAKLQDAVNPELSIESRFDLAYNAAHAFALAALRARGYRSVNRYTVFQCLVHTAGLSSPEWRVLNDAHRKRNTSEYEGVMDIQEAFLESLIRITRTVSDRLEQ